MAVAVLLSAAGVCLASCRGLEHPPEPDPLEAGPLPLPRGTIGTGRGCGACNVECQTVGAGSAFGRLVTADSVGLLWLLQSCSPGAYGLTCHPSELKASPDGTQRGLIPLARFYHWSGVNLAPALPALAASDEAVYWSPNASVSRRGSDPLPEINVSGSSSSPDTFAMNSTAFFSVRARSGLVRTDRATGSEEVLTPESVRILALDGSALIAEVTPTNGGARYVARYNLGSTGPADVLVELSPEFRAHAAVLSSDAVALMIGHMGGWAWEDGQVVWVYRDGTTRSLLEQAPGVEMAAVAYQDGFVVTWANCFALGDGCAQAPRNGQQWWRGGVYQWQPGSSSFRALCEGALQARSVVSDGTYVYVMTQQDILRLRP